MLHAAKLLVDGSVCSSSAMRVHSAYNKQHAKLQLFFESGKRSVDKY